MSASGSVRRRQSKLLFEKKGGRLAALFVQWMPHGKVMPGSSPGITIM
jgi:hypothetical protein